MHKVNTNGNFWRWLCILLFVGSAVGFGWWSYILVDPNLVLSSWQPYWHAQQELWRTFLPNRPLLTHWYEVLLAGLSIGYLGLLVCYQKKAWKWWLPAVVLVPFGLAHNALSHDVYNYIFNAKMVLVYHANPHVQVALDFASDPYVRFMHNVHTPAPYGYGWTALSLLPYLAGFGKFLGQWILFRGMSLASYLGLVAVLWWYSKKTGVEFRNWATLALLINPLLLVEIISNSHNDLWMMVPAMFSILWLSVLPKGSWVKVALSLLLLGLSISTKFATGLLIPIWLLILAKPYLPSKWRTRVAHYWPLLASGLMILPLLTSRSQQFQPWYLSWALVWLPLIKQKTWRYWLIILSLSSLFRYVPWLLSGEYSPEIIYQQKMITWLPALAGGGLLLVRLLSERLISHQKPLA